MKKIISLVIVIAAVVGGGAYWHWQEQGVSQPSFRYDEVKRGHLVATITSTGTLQPRELVDVGAQVAGRIVSIGKDPNTRSGFVDWGSEVEGPVTDANGNIAKPGTILAQIDDELYKAQLKSAEAAVRVADAELKQKKATLAQATADWNRAQRLFEAKSIAQAEYDQFHAQYEVANANAVAAEAQIGVAQANMRTAQTNLNYTTITSPVNGIVIDRRVNVGQTVVASLSAPSLFLIANDRQ
jgi:HlyD family secretion protein